MFLLYAYNLWLFTIVTWPMLEVERNTQIYVFNIGTIFIPIMFENLKVHLEFSFSKKPSRNFETITLVVDVETSPFSEMWSTIHTSYLSASNKILNNIE